MTNHLAHVADRNDEGDRLDRAVARITGAGLRAARRMIEGGRVKVSGVSRPAAWKLRPGELVTVDQPGHGDAPSAPEQGHDQEAVREDARPLEAGVRLLTRTASFAALYKPAGLHTASLAGGGGASLEVLLPRVLPDSPQGAAVLVNRLDRDTSGIVLAAFGQENARAFRQFEDAGKADKRYFALAGGRIGQPAILAWDLDTADRTRVRALNEPAADPLRVTRVVPLAHLEDSTLVEARIAKGARHQIRAHLAKAGHPLLGDALYGGLTGGGTSGAGTSGGGLKLHHWRCSFPGFYASCPPDWPDRPDAQEAVTAFLQTPEADAPGKMTMEDSPCAN